MSLTSYRAAPPRDKTVARLRKPDAETNLANARGRRSIPSGGFLRRQPGQSPWSRGAYVPTQDCFGKARERSFRGFMTVKTRIRAFSVPIESERGSNVYFDTFSSPNRHPLRRKTLCRAKSPRESALARTYAKAQLPGQGTRGNRHGPVPEKSRAERPGGRLPRHVRTVAVDAGADA